MTVKCPNCEWSAEVPDEKIPAGGGKGTCPKCQTKFEVHKEAKQLIEEPPVLLSSTQRVTRACPLCGEEILSVAKKCKHCQSMIVDAKEETPVTQSSQTNQSITDEKIYINKADPSRSSDRESSMNEVNDTNGNVDCHTLKASNDLPNIAKVIKTRFEKYFIALNTIGIILTVVGYIFLGTFGVIPLLFGLFLFTATLIALGFKKIIHSRRDSRELDDAYKDNSYLNKTFEKDSVSNAPVIVTIIVVGITFIAIFIVINSNKNAGTILETAVTVDGKELIVISSKGGNFVTELSALIPFSAGKEISYSGGHLCAGGDCFPARRDK